MLFLTLLGVFLPMYGQAQTIHIPEAPGKLQASAVSAFQISLTWNDESRNEDGFKIERSTDGTNFTQVAQVPANTTNYLSTGLFPGTTYSYRVRAYNSAGNSRFSKVASANTPCTVSVASWGYPIGAPPTNLTGVAATAAGGYHSLALKSDGTVVGWGYNGSGQTTPPTNLTGVVAVAAGDSHSLALKSDGTVVGWGYYDYATPPADLTNVVAVDAGQYHSLALKSDGSVVGWGYDGYGAATPPAHLTNVVAIVGGFYHSLALKSDGTVVGWGSSFYGESTPPTNLAGVMAIAAGGYHSLALKSDGTIVGWGYDGYGEATPPAGLTGGAAAIAAGSYYSLALTVAPSTPSAPTAIVVATNQLDLSWFDTSANEDGFKIERAPDDGLYNPGTWAQIATVSANITNYSDMGAMTNATYWYRVQSSNTCGNSPYSYPTVVSVVPPGAPYLYATVVATNQVEVNLQWDASSGIATGYKIERAPDISGSPGAWTEIVNVVGTYNTFYSDTVATTSATYWYRVRAYNALGDSDYSYPISVSVAPPPYAPYYLYSYLIATNQPEVDVYWNDYYNDAGNVTGYRIERAPDVSGSPGTWTEIATVLGRYNNFYGDTAVMVNTTYWYRVRAYNAVGNSPSYSYPISVRVGPPLYAPYAYAYVIATNQAEVFLYWYDYNNYSGSVAGYWIERAPDVGGNPGTWARIAAVSGYNYYSSYSDTDVTPNTTYWYRVRAYNVIGSSDYSYPISIVVGPPLYAPYAYAYLVITNQPEIHLYWYDYNNNLGSVAGYKIERAPDVGGNPGTWAEIATVAGYNYFSSYTDTVAPTNATYWYRVRAYNVIGNSPSYSSPISIGVAPPAAPYYLNASLPTTSREVDLYWYNSSGTEAGYKIERAPDVGGSAGTWTQIATTVGQYSTSYSDTTVETNTTYWYRVRAYNAVGDSPPSYAVSIGPPAAPSNLTAAIAATNQVNLSWSESYANVAGFKIERAPDDNGNPGTWTEIATTIGQYSTSYSDTTVETNTTYWYRVRAYNVLGDSPYSNEASVTIAPPPAPSNLSATPVSSSQINLSWTDNSNNETSFKIERSADGTNFTQIAQVLANTTNYRNTALFPETTYYYRVRASNPVDDSAFSNVASAGTLALCPTSVVGWGYDYYGQATPPAGLSNVVAIAAGYSHSLALDSDGTVVGWGYDFYATPPTNLAPVVAIAAGREHHSLALQSDGTVVGWGNNYYGETIPPAGLTGVVAIAAGTYHSLALKSDGTVVGWGYYYYATPPAGLAGVVAIAAGQSHSLALKSDGTVVGWGYDGYGQATPPAGLTGVVAIAAGGLHSLALKSDGTVVGWGYSYYATPPTNLTGVVAITAGDSHSLALKSDGTVVGWGYDAYGQATPPIGLSGVVAVAAGAYHSLALSTVLGTPSAFTATAISASGVGLSWTFTAGNADGFKIERAPDNGGSPGTWTQIATVGANVTTYTDTGLVVNTTYWYRVRAYNVCGDSDYSNQASATPVPPPSAPSSLTATTASASQINLSWTDNSSNEDGFKVERSADGTNFTQIAQVLPDTTSYRNTGLAPSTTYYYRVRAYKVGVNSDFSNVASASTTALCPTTVVAWGDNWAGQATPPAGLTGAVAVSAIGYHSLALMSDSTVVGWGYNCCGQTTVPPGLTGVAAIAAGGFHSLSLKNDGTVVGWGSNGNGQTTPPAGLTGVVAIAAGWYHSLALKSDGTVVGWGSNDYGETIPPTGLTGVVAISAGYYYSLALKSDGTVVGWGQNDYGKATPPGGLTGVTAIAAGGFHSLALRSNGTVVGWGFNGNGTATPPAGLTGVIAVACGWDHSLALKSDGTIVGWGNNNYGEATSPAGLVGVVAISAGVYDSLALSGGISAPSALAATVISSDQITLSWTDNASNEDGFKIERAPDSGGGPGTWTQIATVGANITIYTDTGVTPNATHWYRVQAYNVCTNSPYSNQASATTAPPPAPSSLTTTAAVTTNQINLSWTDNSNNEDGFKIERAPDAGGSPGTWTQITTVGANITTYSDTGVAVDTTYWYRVRAYNALGDSPYSNEASALPAPQSAQQIAVMQWNVLHGLGRQSNNSSTQARAIARIINYNQPDILLFNEVDANGLSAAQNEAAIIDWVTNNVPYLGTQTGVTFFVSVSTPSPQHDFFIRNAAVSRYPILAKTTYDDGLRGLHAIRVQLGGTNELQVYHAHLKCCADDCPRKHYEAQFDADTISAWATTNTIPYIFAGDWNDDEQSPLCAPPNTITTIREGGGLAEFKPTTLSGEYRTWSTRSGASIRFDYILAASNRLSASSGYVFSTMNWASHGLYTNASPQNLVNDTQTASDHYCVFVKYFFPGPDFTVTPTNAFASAGTQGGPFSPSEQVYTLSNTNSISLPWGVTKSASWLAISATNGTLAAGASTNITVSINSTANSLSSGSYADSIRFGLTATGAYITRSASLTVLLPPPPVVDFTGSPTNGVEPLTVTFSDASTGNITGRAWDFGDTSTTNTTTNSVTHTFMVGNFSVRLIVSGPGGITTNVRPNYITAWTAFQNWLIQYFGCTDCPQAEAAADPDGDGQNNEAEFLAGTNPTNDASVLRITSITRDSSNIRITWTTAGGRINMVQGAIGTFDEFGYPISPAYANEFFDISDPIGIAGSGDAVTNFVDDGSWLGDYTNWPARYYRIRVVP